jgi:hypothetical protein
VLRRRHQHRRRRDRLPRGVYGRAARRHRCGRGGFPGLLVLEIWGREWAKRDGHTQTGTEGRRRRREGGRWGQVASGLVGGRRRGFATPCGSCLRGLYLGPFLRFY